MIRRLGFPQTMAGRSRRDLQRHETQLRRTLPDALMAPVARFEGPSETARPLDSLTSGAGILPLDGDLIQPMNPSLMSWSLLTIRCRCSDRSNVGEPLDRVVVVPADGGFPCGRRLRSDVMRVVGETGGIVGQRQVEVGDVNEYLVPVHQSDLIHGQL